MKIYKVAIIEDKSFDYEKLRKKIDLDDRLEFDDNLPCTKKMEFEDYCKELLETNADIFFVDWELQFKYNQYSLENVFDWLIANKFNFKTKYWIFYTNKEALMTSYVKRHFPLGIGCYETTGKNEVIGSHDEEEKNIWKKKVKYEDYFNESIVNSICYLKSIQVPDEIHQLPFNPSNNLEFQFTKVFDLDSKPGRRGRLMVKFNPERFLCYIYNRHNGIFCFFDELGILKFDLVKVSDSNIFWREIIDDFDNNDFGYFRRVGLIFNTYFFNDNGYLKDEFREYINSLSPQIRQSYKFTDKDLAKSAYTNTKHIDEIIQIAIRYEILISIEKTRL